MNADGCGQEHLSDTLDLAGSNLSPEWSACGNKINKIVSMHRGPSASGESYWMNSDGSDPKNLTIDGSEDDAPAFFPDYHNKRWPSPATGAWRLAATVTSSR
jgi:hypothetical protein